MVTKYHFMGFSVLKLEGLHRWKSTKKFRHRNSYKYVWQTSIYGIWWSERENPSSQTGIFAYFEETRASVLGKFSCVLKVIVLNLRLRWVETILIWHPKVKKEHWKKHLKMSLTNAFHKKEFLLRKHHKSTS